ncbi:UvrD-helicase domain-containing protein [Cupriavidus sp. M-11]|uniref:UvrD-helicase domain-containing protein n=1 Tax=Cupriavidus sp. M-11 TaxID=3233038 RepID=UPI003F930568
MSKYPLDETVLARPWPSLDEDSLQPDRRFQFLAYQEALQLLLNSSSDAVVHSIPAGAGSGKTRLLVAILNGLLRNGVPPHRIEAISFTNASANDFRRKHIESSVQIATGIELSPQNICFSTIHQCAMNVLKKLQPHMGGVGYYFEDSRTGGQDDDEEEKRKAVRLALYASVVYGRGEEALLDSLARYAEGNDKAFILEDLGEPGHHLERAERLIREELVSDAGLGAFTNMSEGGPDYCIAVATDALMRLHHAEGITLDAKRDMFGIPSFLAVDEAQDLDFLQLLFLRALAQNGSSIILVGDPRQTLYEFRNSLSDYPFRKDFMDDLVAGSGIRASISEHALRTNYRCRKEIIGGAEDVSELIVNYSIERNQKGQRHQNLEQFKDPPAVKRGLYDDRPIHAKEKGRAALSVIIGEPAAGVDDPPSKAPSAVKGALGLLPEFRKEATDSKSPGKTTAKRPRASQVVGLSGGPNEELIRRHLAKLYERAALGETAAIITRNGVRRSDLTFLQKTISETQPDAAKRLKLNLISPPKHTPLAEYWFPDVDGHPVRQLPFSSVMFAGALAFILSSDRDTQQRLKISGKRELHHIYVRPDGIRETEQRSDCIDTIAEELKVFFGGLSTKLTDLFPDADPEDFSEHFDKLRQIVARFTFDVLVQYGRLLWATRKVPQPYPCRFHQMACVHQKGRYEGMAIRQLGETKGYLKLMWRALSSTRFGLTEAERSRLSSAGLKPEFMDAATCMNNFPQSIDDYCSVRGISNKDLDQYRERFINDRETIYGEFSQLWHIKTRTYMREIARGLGQEVRANPQSAEESYRLVVWQASYLNARYKSRTSITYKAEKNQYGGLFIDLVNGLKHDAIVQRRNGKATLQPDDVGIDLTTIHSSKGLEWDHVVLYFPQPSPNDKDSSFKACRDLIYVAMTRAARSLTIVLQKRKKLIESATDTGIKVIVELMHRWAEDNEYYNRAIDWGDIRLQDDGQETMVYDETSHSELERSQTCRMHHYYEDMRSLSTMVPLTPPSYAFFFHGTMSTICASFIQQRLPSKADPSIPVAAAVAQIVDRDLQEDEAYRFLKAQVHGEIYILMESMIPMYFLGDRTRHHALLTYYTDTFAHHLAAIAASSQLFVTLKACRGKPAYRILIEKGVRTVLPTSAGNELLPIVGIPDIKILGPDLTYVADYKTVPLCEEGDDDEALEAYERTISTKTQQQVNYYQGMVQAKTGHRYLAEILYVADATLFEYDNIPRHCDVLPHIGQGSNFKITAGVDHARIVYTDRFDRDQFAETVGQIRELRTTYLNSAERPTGMFEAVPLVGGGPGEVTLDQCRHCGSGVHCAFNKFLHINEVDA